MGFNLAGWFYALMLALQKNAEDQTQLPESGPFLKGQCHETFDLYF